MTGPAAGGVVEVGRREARRVALSAQGLTRPRPAGRVGARHFRGVLDRLGTVQLDSVNVLARSHELVFFSRLGSYDRAALARWLWGSHEVFEYWGHEASLHPVGRHPLLRWRMADEHRWKGVREVARRHPDLVAQALAEVRERGPVGIGDMEVNRRAPRRAASWWGWGDGKRVVEALFHAGQVTAIRPDGFTRSYLAPELWIPAEVLAAPTPAPDEARKGLLEVAARCHGLGTARDLADYYRLGVAEARRLLPELVEEGRLVAARVEGWRPAAYLHPDAARPGRRRAARALLSPFDSLVWERGRTERLFGFRYRVEIYVPPAERVHGYYVLPFLLDEALVGRVDLKADRREGVLRVPSAWGEPGPVLAAAGGVDRVTGELADELAAVAGWLGLARVAVEPRGDLAPRLAAAVAARDRPVPAPPPPAAPPGPAAPPTAPPGPSPGRPGAGTMTG
ncbi:MAG TPA: crosslink repair DNA glycosylase YcaQ family protein [Acidimicrobiales bacterium]|nr:crosslink repair DNA glycosylase YcaQ family protein [Acidimicrobiales bacterium]